MNNELYLIWGPTSTGKTALSVNIAKKTGYPVIALDRFQGYQEIVTGSGAPDAEELQGTERIYLSDKPLIDGIISAQDVNNRLKDKIAELSTAEHGVILEGGSVSILTALCNDEDWSKPSWRIKIFNIPSSNLFIKKAKTRVTGMFYPPNHGQSILKEIRIFFDTYHTIQPLEDIDGYRVIIRYCKENAINIHTLDSISDQDKNTMINLIANEYFEHALWQENNFPSIPDSWKWRELEI
ncbi:hypothetical protein KP22_12155 [Pectobacterium betavasculorum]|uniref:Uncharacterized protein n=1 Tax=Pectobacterium betavasculorum TaxID=55207 RepID=A0A093VF71_9GAMM|nr:isopentenyl transferase family protein [Pectobacterium betavasculorum]KFX05447.1 hypothetical protein KP22_12155 [Pectobacterium betavasculorum]KFX19228.1 hypothetical protein JV35_15785 [Pectobacterium betavasculorum]